jgi:uncharacterized cupredoxin-like copper-binding protein
MFLRMTITLLACSAASLAVASPGHSDNGSSDGKTSTFAGRAGQIESVDRVVQVKASDQMRFNSNDWAFRPGETIRFVVTNTGQIPHELVIDTIDGHASHRETMMQAMASGGMMEHNDPNAVSVAPGETDELVWTFSETGTFEAACNIPGHYQAGMRASIDVVN